jgi:hypothetical protein
MDEEWKQNEIKCMNDVSLKFGIEGNFILLITYIFQIKFEPHHTLSHILIPIECSIGFSNCRSHFIAYLYAT